MYKSASWKRKRIEINGLQIKSGAHLVVEADTKRRIGVSLTLAFIHNSSSGGDISRPFMFTPHFYFFTNSNWFAKVARKAWLGCKLLGREKLRRSGTPASYLFIQFILSSSKSLINMYIYIYCNQFNCFIMTSTMRVTWR